MLLSLNPGTSQAAFLGPVPINPALTDSEHDYDVSVASDGQGTWVAVWWRESSGATSVVSASSIDDGRTWSVPKTIASPGFNPNVTTDGLGNWVVVWADSQGGTNIKVARITTSALLGGGSWIPTSIGASLALARPKIATDRLGNWVAVWEGGPQAQTSLILASRITTSNLLNGSAWTSPAAINAVNGVVQLPSIATDGAGNWFVAFRRTTPSVDRIEGARITTAALTSNGSWASTGAISASDLTGRGELEVASDEAGNWVTVWHEVAAGRTYFARSSNTGASWTTPAALLPGAPLPITGGPVYTLPGGGSCTVSGIPSRGTGATVSCTGINLSGHAHVYYGIKNNTTANGNALDGTGPSGTEIYRFSSSGASSIAYTSTTTVNNVLLNPTQPVSNTLTITRTGGTATVVSTGGLPASRPNGDIERLFEITGGSTLTLRVTAESSSSSFGPGISNPAVFDPTHTGVSSGRSDIVRVDLAFYYSDCEVAESAEETDSAVAIDGSSAAPAGVFPEVQGDPRPHVVADRHGNWLAATYAGQLARIKTTDLLANQSWTALPCLDATASANNVYLATDGLGNLMAAWAQSGSFGSDYDVLADADIAPYVVSIERLGSSSTGADEVVFIVTFSEPVSGLDIDDFELMTDIADAQILAISVGPSDEVSIVQITVSTGTTNGTIRLGLADDDSIVDRPFGIPVGGWGPGNGDFEGGESYDVDHTALKFGEDIVAFEARRSMTEFTYDDVDWANTGLPRAACSASTCQGGRRQGLACATDDECPDSHTVQIDSAKRLLAGEIGPFEIDWRFKDGTGYKAVYFTSEQPVDGAVVLYHTDSGTIRPGSADPVDLELIPNITIHYNTQIRFNEVSQLCASPFRANDYLCLDAKNLRSRDKEGLILIEYSTAGGDPIGVEVVEVKQDLPDVPPTPVDVGSRLRPFHDVPDRRAHVLKGITDSYIYQHLIEGSPQEDEVWAIRRNQTASNMDVIWMRPSPAAAQGGLVVEWPYERRQYTSQWPIGKPEKYQLYVRAESPTIGPDITIPNALHPNKACPTLCEEFENTTHHATLTGGVFHTDGPGWTLLQYGTGPIAGQEWVGFEVVRSVRHNDPAFLDQTSVNRDVGTEITDAYHEGPLPGYIHRPEGDRYFETAYTQAGQILPVNTGTLEVWWSNASRTEDPEGSDYPAWPTAERVYWPSKVVRYDAQWPTASEKIIIARQNGTGPIDDATFPSWDIYFQNDAEQIGFNPNDEHALKASKDDGLGIFALRDDLGSAETSLPYVLMQYRDPQESSKWRFKVWKVLREESPYFFHDWAGIVRPQDPYEGLAGQLIQAPFPLGTLQYADNTEGVSGPYFEDRDGRHWVRAAGNDGGPATIVMHYYYQVQPGFYFPPSVSPSPAVGDEVPLLDDGSGTPIDVQYTVTWPDEIPTMKVGDTLITAKNGLPDINGQCSVDVVYQQSDPNVEPGNSYTMPSATLVDPIRAREVDLASIPTGIVTAQSGDEVVFSDLSLALRLRVSYLPLTTKLRFKGLLVNPVTGSDYAVLNVMSNRERDELRALSNDGAWRTAVDALYAAAKDPIEISDSATQAHDALALTTGFARGVGYVTLALQNAGTCDPLPVSLEIIRVVADLDPGSILAITPECPFDETLTLRHRGDFGGRTDSYKFEWRYLPDEDGTAPPGPYESWNAFAPQPSDGQGAVDITIEGPGLLTLSDNWFVARYQYTGTDLPWAGQWSEWASPQLAEGWIKRVVGDIDPFTQRASGGGIEGAETAFESYGEQGINTIVSMISQAGPRWEGSVPLNCSNLDGFGLLEIYETVLNRGIAFSIDGLPAVDYPPANNALLLIASRIADLYSLLGNEAFADAADPTIAFGTDDGQFGSEASSIHCFQNVTSSLIDEELALLRGRDDHLAPGVQVSPLYNRLIWNFTKDATGGEVAYALNYNILDQSGNADGQISELDARVLYPQGHGDAWGHYLTAINTYYRLLVHPNYTWAPRAEGLLVGGVPVTVDYLDERKFASTAAAKARAGAELVNLTYRSSYVEDPSGQWQGYKDSDRERAWGVADWASRAGQGTYFDWVVGNAILPAVDPNPGHTGIQKVDRITIPELREVASRYEEIQAQLDTADVGLSPLGLGSDVIPFDISPAEITSGKTHFEQIYERAVGAMNNAIAVFNHANNSSQLLRRQADTLADFQQTVEDREVDFRNRLIESFGYPYSDDIGPGRSYPSGYDGPDLFHYSYVDASELTGMDPADLNIVEVPVTVTGLEIADGLLETTPRLVTFHIATSGDRFGEVKPPSWTGERRAPGEIQLARSDLLQARARFERALVEYENLLTGIEDQVALLEAQSNLNATEINVLNEQSAQERNLQLLIRDARSQQLNFRAGARIAGEIAAAVAEFLPTAVGFSNDVAAPARGAIRLAGGLLSEALTSEADRQSLVELDHQNALQNLQSATNIRLTTLRGEFAVQQALSQLEQSVRQELALRLELYTLQEAMQQASGRYLAALARGQRLLEERSRFRRQTAAEIQARRYKDMAFRVFRNDALQKYRAQFDLAARYVYLAAKAYDFETTLLSSDPRAGERFLTDIVRERAIGGIQSGIPQTGVGLADPLARMSQNFSVLKGQLGFNIPQQETNRFSLRSELFRIQAGSAGNAAWRETLRQHVVPNLLNVPEFQQYARIFDPHQTAEPAIVIPITTNINFALNFFGWPAGGGDNAYDSTNFATKVRSVGVWFSNYNNLSMSNTPRVYLFPVGSDVLRSPTRAGVTRQFRILDQSLPAPFTIGSSDLNDPEWIPSIDSLTDTFAQVRKYSSFRAYHDAGQFDPSQTIRDSRLIGRSVWNTKWLLIIPAGTLNSDRIEGLDRFIDGRLVSGNMRDGNGVSDIKIFFETYAYSGN